MARRRKVGGRRKGSGGGRGRKNTNIEENLEETPSETPIESEESCPSPGKQIDTSTSSFTPTAPPPEPSCSSASTNAPQAQEILHKKFGKFRCLVEKDYAVETTPNFVQVEETPPIEESIQSMEVVTQETEIPFKVIEFPTTFIEQHPEQVILESEPVWGEEIIEETVVCEGIGNLEIDQSTDNSQSVESKDSDSQDCQLKIKYEKNTVFETIKTYDSKDANSSNDEKDVKVETENIQAQFADMTIIKESGEGNGGSNESSDVNESNDGSGKIRRSSRIRSIGIMKLKAREVRDPVKQVMTPPRIEEDRENSNVVPESISSITLPPEPDTSKPVKVKSRWRRSSELELGGGNKGSDSDNTILSVSCTNSPTLPPTQEPQIVDENDERLRQFEIIQENEYLTEKQTSKEAKRMLCDCFLTKEEIARGEQGCGEDCLNRLLMIECGPRCVLGELCSNKHFQRHENAKCQVIKTDKKGYGLQVMEDLPPGAFIMEYVGEVIDPREFRRRAKEYARDKNRHYYFMALKSDSIIDATARGSISRFINHSCDPNSETQKWTVNGELRIGFFTKTAVRAGDEITFDYQLQRYGKDAQRCYCEAPNCRGWIGEDPAKEKAPISITAITPSSSTSVKKSSSSSSSTSSTIPATSSSSSTKKKESTKAKDFLDDMDLEEEITKICSSGLKNRAHTLTFCRLMVRASDQTSRLRLLQLLREGETACRRLFLDYHGLRLLWSWMVDDSEADLRTPLLEALAALPIPNKTMLQDSKVLSVVEKWAIAEPSLSTPVTTTSDESSGNAEGASNEQTPSHSQTVSAAAALLAEWSSLKEVFRIPKRERIEQMKEHEREADRGYNEYLDTHQSYTSSWRQQVRRIDTMDSSNQSKKNSKPPQMPRDPNQPRLSKHERRHQFALKVAQQEEQERHRRHQEDLWRKHEAHCLSLGLNPTHWISYDPNTGLACYLNQATNKWLPFTPPEGGLPVYPEMPPAPAQRVETYAPPLPRIRLPPQWRSARDNLGRVYYYHIIAREPQWEPPVWELAPTTTTTGGSEESDDDSTEDEEEDSAEEEEEEESESGGEESDNDQSEVSQTSISSTSSVLVTTNTEEEEEPSPESTATSQTPTTGTENEEPADETNETKDSTDSPKIESTEAENSEISATKPESRKRREGLVQERIISPRREEDRVDSKHYRAVKAQLRRKKELAKQRDKKRRRSLSSSANSSSNADGSSKSDQQSSSKGEVSSEQARKIKDQFRLQMANNIVTHLNPYRKQDCKVGRITNTEDFKHLARKLTHFVMLKELKHCRSVEELVCNENVKHKARDFIKKYMAKFGAVYQRPKDDD